MITNYIIAVFIFILFFLGIIGNSLVLFVLLRQISSWSPTTTYLFNLAVADTLFLCTTPFWGHYYLNKFDWWFGLGMCKLSGALTSINMYASIFFLVAMSMDRWLAVVHATQVSRFRNRTVARWVSCGIWCLALLLALPRFLYQVLRVPQLNTGSEAAITANTTEETYGVVTPGAPTAASVFNSALKRNDQSNITQCILFIPTTDLNKQTTMGFIQFINAMIGFVIPMIVISVCYVQIVITVKKKVISRRVSKDRIAKLAAFVIIAFFICWLPAQMMNLYSAVSGWWHAFYFSEPFFSAVYPYALCLAWANSCINPFVYAFTTTNFQENVKDICSSDKSVRPYRMTLSVPGQHKEDKIIATPQAKRGVIFRYSPPVQVHVAKDLNEGNPHPGESVPTTGMEEQSFSYYSCPAVMQGLGKMNSELNAESSFPGGAHSTPANGEIDSCVACNEATMV
ncbi:unnamed protein product [Clavelina lepadiformis]|uniref:G-protein coupled receptors family 1 profile domain-containing protein n=1 Tax=Clavelina lepadiformis TaxID=159417 RepID=A0ABP0FLV4_CLALP